MTLSPIAYLTCEIKGRDFRSRLLIAAHLIKMGYPVVVGQYWNLVENASVAPRGCYLFKTSNRFQVEGMEICARENHVVVASDEEALSTSEVLAAHTTDSKTFDYCKLYLALNDAHRRALLKAFPSVGDRILVAGTARADLLRAETHARPSARPYVLVNTSFGWLNSIWGSHLEAIEIYAAATNRDLSNPEDVAVLQSRFEYEQVALRETRKLVKWLVKTSDSDVIVRPHPNEKLDLWNSISGLKVVAGSDPYPWLRHAVVSIHNDSTSGLEAAIMGAPTLNLSPLDSWAQRLNVRQFNKTVRTAEEAQSAIIASDYKSTETGEIVPQNGAQKVAEAIASQLPPPYPVSLGWAATARSQQRRDKITVSLSEAQTAVADIFAIAGVPQPVVAELTDTVFLLHRNRLS